MMISPSWGLPPRRRQRWGESRLFSRIRRSTRLRATRMSRQTRSSSPDLAVALALPGRCLQVGFDRHQQRLGPRSRASVPDALPAAARRAGRRSWRRTRSGPCPRRRRPSAGRSPDPCRTRWRHSSPRPPPPQRAEGLIRPPAVPPRMVNSPTASWRYASSACTGSPLTRRQIPPIGDQSRKISTPNWRDRSCTGPSRKSRRTTSRLRATVHRWPSPSQACRQSLAWGRGRSKRPHLPAVAQTPTFFSKLGSCEHTSIKPMLVQGNRPTHDALRVLRNEAGTVSHGKDEFIRKLSVHHRRVALLAADAVVTFLHETYLERDPDPVLTLEPFERFA